MVLSLGLRPGRIILLSSVLSLTAWACSDSDKEKIQAKGLSAGCTLNSECSDPLVCTFARCHQECAQDRDCKTGEERCVKGATGFVCQLAVETDCTKDKTVCKGTQVCGIDGECRDACTTSTDCTPGQVCAPSGQCASTDPKKDTLDSSGNILPDPFVDSSGGTGGTGGTGNTNKGGATGKGGATSSGGGPEMSGGAGGDLPIEMSGGKTSTGSGGKTAGFGGAPGAGGSVVTTGGAGGEGGTVPFECPPGKGECDPTDPTDCETFLTLATSCGACGVSCGSVHGTSVCDAATLTCKVMGACTQGYADCNTSGVDGCEVTLATDPKNCGTCGRDCGGGTCTNGQCGAAIVFDPTGATTLTYNYTGSAVLTGSTLVKVNTSSGTEIRVATLPTTPDTLKGTALVTNQSNVYIYGLHADAANVYYSLSGSPNATVLWKPLTAMETSTPKTAVTMPDTYYAKIITSNATALYMVNAANVILAAGKSLTAAQPASPPSGLTTARSTVNDLVVAGGYLYWLEAPNVVYAYSLVNGGAPVAVDSTTQSGYSGYQGIATDGSYVYWSTYNGSSSKIRRLAVSAAPSPDAVQDVAIGIAAPSSGLAVDANYVYYYYQNATVWRVVKDGSITPTQIGTVNATPYFYSMFAVDSGYVYGVGGSGQIVRVAKAPSGG